MVGSYLVLFTPGLIVLSFNPMTEPIPPLHATVYLLAWSHAFINPIIYIYFNGFFRREIGKILKIEESTTINTESNYRSGSRSRKVSLQSLRKKSTRTGPTNVWNTDLSIPGMWIKYFLQSIQHFSNRIIKHLAVMETCLPTLSSQGKVEFDSLIVSRFH